MTAVEGTHRGRSLPPRALHYPHCAPGLGFKNHPIFSILSQQSSTNSVQMRKLVSLVTPRIQITDDTAVDRCQSRAEPTRSGPDLCHTACPTRSGTDLCHTACATRPALPDQGQTCATRPALPDQGQTCATMAGSIPEAISVSVWPGLVCMLSA